MSIRDEIHLLKHENVYLSRTVADLKTLVFGLCICLVAVVVVLVTTGISREHQIKELRSQVINNRNSMRNNAVRIAHLEEGEKALRKEMGLGNE